MEQSTNTSAIISLFLFPQLHVIPQATTKSWALHQVGIMTEKIKKLEQLVRIKDSKIEVGRIQLPSLPSLPYCSRLSRVIIPDDPIVPGKTELGGSPHHALGGCVQTWSLKDVDVKAKHWNKQRHVKLSQMKVSWCVMMCHDVCVHFTMWYGSRRRVWPHDTVWKWRNCAQEHKIGVPLSEVQQCPRPRAAGFTTIGWKRTHERNISIQLC